MRTRSRLYAEVLSPYRFSPFTIFTVGLIGINCRLHHPFFTYQLETITESLSKPLYSKPKCSVLWMTGFLRESTRIGQART